MPPSVALVPPGLAVAGRSGPGPAPATAVAVPRLPGDFRALVGAAWRPGAGSADASPAADQAADDIGPAAPAQSRAPAAAPAPARSEDEHGHAARTSPRGRPNIAAVADTPKPPSGTALAVALPAGAIAAPASPPARSPVRASDVQPDGRAAKSLAAPTTARTAPAEPAGGEVASPLPATGAKAGATPGAIVDPTVQADDGDPASLGDGTPPVPPGTTAAKPVHARADTAERRVAPAQDSLQPASPATTPSGASRDLAALPPPPPAGEAPAPASASASAAVSGQAAAAGAGQPASPTPSAPQTATAPAAQLGHALAALHTGADGSSHVVVRLDPAELGQVQVRLTRLHDGAASVSVSVERPETLRSLQADLGHLHQMLDRAGVSDQRSLTLHLAPQDAAGASAGNASGQGAGNGAQSQQHGARQQDRAAPPAPAGRFQEAEGAPPGVVPAPLLRWRRAGINITA